MNAACTQQTRKISLSVPVVFVPSFLGSVLVDDSDKEVYVTASIGLALDTPNIKLPITWNCRDGKLPTQEKDDIRSKSPLKSVKFEFCGCTSIPILHQYSTFCNHFEQYDNFHSFGYDWRRDLNETTDLLLDYLERIKVRYGVAAQVISHSMGCLIAVAAYNTEPSLFHSTLFCGGMFAGGFGFYPTNTEGMMVGLNKKYLGPDVVHTFPSMYAAASPMGVGKDPILRNCEGRQLWQFADLRDMQKNVDIDMWKYDDWKKFRIGPFFSGEISPAMEEHVKTCLRLGYEFQLKMRNLEVKDNGYVEKGSKYIDLCPPVAVLVGDQYLKPDSFLWDTEESKIVEWTPALIKKLNPSHFAKTDGTVSYISASQPPIPNGVKVKEYLARNNGPGLGTHRDIMNDIETVELILNELKETLCVRL